MGYSMISRIITVLYKKFLDIYLGNKKFKIEYFLYSDDYKGECKFLNGLKPTNKWYKADGFYILGFTQPDEYKVLFAQHLNSRCFLGFHKLMKHIKDKVV